MSNISIIFATCLLVISCKPESESIKLNLDIKSSKVSNMLFGQGLPAHLEVDFTDRYFGKGTLKRVGNLISISFDTSYIDGLSSFYILDKEFDLSLNDYTTISSYQIDFRLNDYVFTKRHLFPVLNNEVLEVLGNRTDITFSYDETYADIESMSIVANILSSSSVSNLSKVGLDVTSMHRSNRGVRLVKNPLTGLVTTIPDLGRLSLVTKQLWGEAIDLKTYHVGRDTLSIRNNFVFRDTLISNKVIIVEPSCQLKLDSGANVHFANCSLLFMGTRTEPIEIFGNGGSLYVEGGAEHSMNWVNFRNIGNFKTADISLPSGVTFYFTDVNISNCTFSNNISGDDYLNIYKSHFNIESSSFNNILSDAFDSDFSIGIIKNTSFELIGNDAIDASGSDIVCDSVLISDVSDKALSAGENSHFVVKNTLVKNAEMAIVVKDGSILEFSTDNSLKKNTLDFVVFQKKSFYSSPILRTDVSLDGSNNLFETGVKIKGKNSDSIVYKSDVKSMLYGKVFGKRTIKS
ncbi:hypothetical protein N9W65_01860 [Schleiferiaceae bacterium]|nr:hypothetical protein [Schleiferiaceae bacterium]